MKINDKSVRGIFVYSDDDVFERGDMVVYGNYLYNVISDTVAGVSPEKDKDNYSIYLSGELGTYEDFKAFTQGNTENGTKLVSAYTINQILSQYMSGFSDVGLINNHILSTGQIFLSSYFNDKNTIINSREYYTNPLDQIISEPILNNSVFTVAGDVVKLVFGRTSFSTNNVILRQYTYLDKTGIEDVGEQDKVYIRIQELIDPDSGITMFRWKSIINDDYNSGKISSWKSTNIDPEFSTRIDNIISYYISKTNELERQKLSLLNSFRYRSLTVTNNSITLPTSSTSSNSIELVLSFRASNGYNSNRVFQVDSIQIPLSELINNGTPEIKRYSIFNGRATVGLLYNNGVITISSFESESLYNITMISANYSQSYADYSNSINSTYPVIYDLVDPNQPLPGTSFVVHLEEAGRNIPSELGITEFNGVVPEKSLTFLVTCELLYGYNENTNSATDRIPIEFYFSTLGLVGKNYSGTATIEKEVMSSNCTLRPINYLRTGKIALNLTCDLSNSSSNIVDLLTISVSNYDINGNEINSSSSHAIGSNSSAMYSKALITSVKLVI